MIEYRDPQGSPEWLAARRGVITASRAKDARDRSSGLDERQTAYVRAILAGQSESEALAASGYKKAPTAEAVRACLDARRIEKKWSGAAISYAQDLARERCGGVLPEQREGFAQRQGHEQEPFGVIAWIASTGLEVEEVGFVATDDRRFGTSLDRRVVGKNAALEVKTMVSSVTLFRAIVDGDVSEYRDQCLFQLWMLSLDWIDLCLWCPDLNKLHIVRIERDEDELQALEDDLVAFDALVTFYELALRRKLGIDDDLINGEPVSVPDERPASASPPIKSATAPAAGHQASAPAPAIPELEF